MSESLAFSAASKQKIQALVARYPRAQAALIPILYLAQDEFGYLKPEVMALVAAELALPQAQVLATAMFYTMLHKHPVGRYQLQICTNVSCYLRGSDELMTTAREELGIEPGQTTPDGVFTLEEVQCLCACGHAPALQVNRDDHFDLTPQKLRELIAELRSAAQVTLGEPAVDHTAAAGGYHA